MPTRAVDKVAHQGGPTTRGSGWVAPPPPSVVVLDLWPFLYNMWVFFLFFFHHPPINHALQTPRPGAESAESGPGSLRCLFIAIDLHDHHVPESSEGGTPGLADDAREWLVSPPRRPLLSS